MRWASLAATGTFTDGGAGTKLHRVVINMPSTGASLTISDATAAGSTLSVAVIDCGTAGALDYDGVLLKNGLFANLAAGASGKPNVTLVYD